MSDKERIVLNWFTDIIIAVDASSSVQLPVVEFVMLHEERAESVTAELTPKEAMKIGKRFIAMAKEAKRLGDVLDN